MTDTILTGEHQASVLGPTLHLLYTGVYPHVKVQCWRRLLITAPDTSTEHTTERLQTIINEVNNWTKKWCYKE